MLSNNNFDENFKILSHLKESEGWFLISSRADSVFVYEKNINNKKINALKVQKVVKSKSENIMNVIMNVSEYPEIMNNEKVTSSIIKKDNKSVYAYNHFPIPIPFMSDRHYIFILNQISNKNVEWVLLPIEETLSDSEIQKIINKNSDAVYMQEGAGFWEVEYLSDNFSQVSYALYMDSAGSISDYLNDYLNSYSIINLFKSVLKKAEEIN
ncbi:MAG: hypothetical protein CBD97_02600 [Pelagibacteraceae bacterium TMED237]|nr:hypothetical protein [Candidatus Neomarinimicrobiota bacterium]OUW95596.1 MAG: hypothetical protein CBD97_02600 [Pelagibacteraceae bacterium TMED237]